MTVLLAAALLMVAAAATVVVLTPDPARQAAPLSVLGLLLAVLFVLLQAPDVALAQLAVGAAIVPLMVLLTIRRAGRRE